MVMVYSFAVSLTAAMVIIPLILYVAHKKEWYDVTNHRKIHNGLIPRLGGIGVFCSFMFALLIVLSCLMREKRRRTGAPGTFPFWLGPSRFIFLVLSTISAICARP